MDEELVDVRTAARRLGLSPPSIYRLIDEGKLPAVRMGPVACIRIWNYELERLKKARGKEKK
jgi:excisionase family DNA binding protein